MFATGIENSYPTINRAVFLTVSMMISAVGIRTHALDVPGERTRRPNVRKRFWRCGTAGVLASVALRAGCMWVPQPHGPPVMPQSAAVGTASRPLLDTGLNGRATRGSLFRPLLKRATDSRWGARRCQ